VVAGEPAIEGIRDRVVHHLRRDSTDPVRVVASQVAEMSLDISAIRLITECCPPVACIQRAGRVNRYLLPNDVVDVLVYLPKGMTNGLPYSRVKDWGKVYSRWMAFYTTLERDYPRGVSQAELEKRLQDFYSDPANRDADREAYTPLLRTRRHNLRHGSVTTPVILKSDLEAFQKKHGRKMYKREVRWFALPAVLNTTQRKELRDKKNIHEYHYILDDSGTGIVYDDRLGLLDMVKV
jgi:CRISPR-associated endonuclease/helicase Cas3